MEIKNYPSNSGSSHAEKKEEPKHIKKVVKGTVKTKKKSELQKFGQKFISEDAGNLKDYVLGDVLIPSIKKAIVDIVTDGINIVMYGDANIGKKRGSKINYCSYSDDRYERSRTSKRRDAYDYDDIILDTRAEAEDVLNSLDEIIDGYDMASVADLYELVGITDTSYTANDYGWFDLRSARTVHVREGWLLKLPRPVPLN